jgi:hypothetical protein
LTCVALKRPDRPGLGMDMELPVDVVEMSADRVFAQVKVRRDLLLAHPGTQPLQHFPFADGKEIGFPAG